MKSDKIQVAYNFLVNKERNKETFTTKEASNIIGWKISTINTYINKQWNKFIIKENKQYKCIGLIDVNYNDFLKFNSQKDRHSFHKSGADTLIKKAHHFALLAVSIYNNPFYIFRVHGYIVNILIAWTSLMHAMFDQSKKNYKYENSKFWDLSKCIDEYWSGIDHPVKSNLQFLLQLRHEIEHRELPGIDIKVSGQCQACLLNFEEVIVEKFGEEYALMTNLSIALQLTRMSEEARINAMKKLQTNEYKYLKDFMDFFEESLTDNIIQSQQYRTSLFLVPKISNHRTSADLSVEFIKFDESNQAEIDQHKKVIIAIREHNVEKLEHGLRPTQVAKMVEEKLQKTFTIGYHTHAWKYYNVRPNNKKEIGKCDTRYVKFSELVKDYLYTLKWVEFLTKRLADTDEYNKIAKFR